MRRRARRPAPEPRQLSAEAVEYVLACERLLGEPAGRRVLEYLVDERGLDPDVLQANRVGADPGRTLRRAKGLPKGGPGAVFPALNADGEIVYRGPTVFLGYWQDTAATAENHEDPAKPAAD